MNPCPVVRQGILPTYRHRKLNEKSPRRICKMRSGPLSPRPYGAEYTASVLPDSVSNYNQNPHVTSAARRRLASALSRDFVVG